MEVTKRNGEREALNIDKIHKCVEWACEGLDVSLSEIETGAHIQMFDGIETGQIQKALINAAASLVDIGKMDYEYAAARLLLQQIYKEVTDGKTDYPPIENYIKQAVDDEILDARLLTFDFEKINKSIVKERDLKFKYLGLKSIYDRYLLKTRPKNGEKVGKVVELPQHFWMRVAMGLAINESEEDKTDWAIKFYELYSKFEFISSTPTLFNSGTTHPQLSSCFVLTVDDSTFVPTETSVLGKGICSAMTESALYSKFSGGVGADWTRVRATGGHIKSTNGNAAGIVPYLKMYNDTALGFDQSGKRSGSFAVYIEPWHGDIERFLDLKKPNGDERLRARELFPALWVNDLFMERVRDKAKWSLFCPNQYQELHELYGEEFKAAYEKAEAEGGALKTLDAFELWKKIITALVESGAPFITFKDEMNRRNPQSHDGVIHSSNLCCMTGDQLVATDIGLITVEELYKRKRKNKVVGLTGFDDASEMLLPRPDAPIVQIETLEGYTHKVTPDHRVWVKDKGWVEAQNLVTGDKLLTQQIEGMWGIVDHPELAAKLGSHPESLIKGVPEIVLSGTRRTVWAYLREVYERFSVKTGDVLMISNINKKWLQELQILWANFGVASKIVGNPFQIDSRFENEDFVNSSLQVKRGKADKILGWHVNIDHCVGSFKNEATFTRLTNMPNEDAYCLTVDSETHAWTVNGLVTHNTEIALNTSDDETAVCNLGSINLAEINPDEFPRIIHIAMRMLDNVIDINFYPTDKSKNSNLNHRPVGLGLMGWTDYIVRKGIDWESIEHLKETDDVFERFSYWAIRSSMRLAAEKGRYKSYRGSKWSKGILPIDTARSLPSEWNSNRNVVDWKLLREAIKEYGMRNSNCTSIAPTATIATLVGTTPSIEPIFKKVFLKENKAGKFKVVDPTMRHGKDWLCKSAYEIDQQWVIKAAAVRQKWLCQAQSVNLFKKAATKGSEISDWYFKAWELGLKSTYYLRQQTSEMEVAGKGKSSTEEALICSLDNREECLSCQ